MKDKHHTKFTVIRLQVDDRLVHYRMIYVSTVPKRSPNPSDE
ncbi:hypothetical protein [Oculatella sp. LEGE 06141]|nr:hypothetical protein [Oculatella sp. LEGE 06141]